MSEPVAALCLALLYLAYAGWCFDAALEHWDVVESLVIGAVTPYLVYRLFIAP